MSLLHFKYAPPTSGSSLGVFSLAPPFDNRQISAGSYRTTSHQVFFSDLRTSISPYSKFGKTSVHTCSQFIGAYELKGTIIIYCKINCSYCIISSQLEWLNLNRLNIFLQHPFACIQLLSHAWISFHIVDKHPFKKTFLKHVQLFYIKIYKNRNTLSLGHQQNSCSAWRHVNRRHRSSMWTSQLFLARSTSTESSPFYAQVSLSVITNCTFS